MADLDVLTYGMVLDIMLEKMNDENEYDTLATADDVAKF